MPYLPPELRDLIATLSSSRLSVNAQNEITTDFMRRRLRNRRLQRSLRSSPIHRGLRRRTYRDSGNILHNHQPITHLHDISMDDPNPFFNDDVIPTQGRLRAYDEHWQNDRSHCLINDVLNNPPPYIWSTIGDRNPGGVQPQRSRVLDEIESPFRKPLKGKGRRVSAPFRKSRKRKSRKMKRRKRKSRKRK